MLRRLREMGFKTALASSHRYGGNPEGAEAVRDRDVRGSCSVGNSFRKQTQSGEIYLTAMAALGCWAGECLVEDSTTGEDRRVAAGLRGSQDSRFPFDQTGAAYRVDSLTEILELPGIAGQNGARCERKIHGVVLCFTEFAVLALAGLLCYDLDRLKWNGTGEL